MWRNAKTVLAANHVKQFNRYADVPASNIRLFTLKMSFSTVIMSLGMAVLSQNSEAPSWRQGRSKDPQRERTPLAVNWRTPLGSLIRGQFDSGFAVMNFFSSASVTFAKIWVWSRVNFVPSMVSTSYRNVEGAKALILTTCCVALFRTYRCGIIAGVGSAPYTLNIFCSFMAANVAHSRIWRNVWSRTKNWLQFSSLFVIAATRQRAENGEKPYMPEQSLSCWEILKTGAELVINLSLAFATFLLALFTWNLAKSTKRLADDATESSKKQIGVNTWLKLKEGFDSELMQKERHRLAKMCVGGLKPSDYVNVSDRLLNFFEDLGLLYDEDLINRKLATECFGFYVCRWWVVLKDYVEHQRKTYKDANATFFDKFQYVAKAMKHPDDGDVIEAEELKQFLMDEVNLWYPR